MKKIEAIIRKSKFDEVKKALHDVGVVFFSYWDVTGVGNEKQGHVYRGVVYSTSDIQRRYLSIVVSDEFVETTVKTILEAAKTGNVGDGKIFICPVDWATAESGEFRQSSVPPQLPEPSVLLLLLFVIPTLIKRSSFQSNI